MKRLLTSSSAFIILFFCTAQDTLKTYNNLDFLRVQAKLKNTKLTQWIENKIDSVKQANNIPAISVAVINQGKVILNQGYGVYNRDSFLIVDEHAIYQIASDTKKMTGIIAKNLVVEGKLKLDEPIVTYLAKSLNEDAIKRLQGITMRQLLAHKSGLPYREPTMKRKDGEPMLIPYTEEDMLHDLNNVELSAEPGSMNYSNFGYAVAGYVCEQTSGETYPTLIKKYVSEVYNMPNTTISLTGQQRQKLVTPYLKQDRIQETSAFTMGKLAAAGGVYSTISDLTNLMMYQIDAYADTNKDNFKNPLILHDDIDSRENGYGFGLGKKIFETGIQYGHGGDLDGFASAYVFSPQYKSGVILLTSSGGRWVGELEKELFYKLTNQDYIPPKKSIALEFYHLIADKGFWESKKWFHQQENSGKYYLKEEEMNNVGYALFQKEKPTDALEVFKFNIALFPNSADAYKGLGEAYLKLGNEAQATQNYEKSIVLDPNDKHTIEVLKSLKNK